MDSVTDKGAPEAGLLFDEKDLLPLERAAGGRFTAGRGGVARILAPADGKCEFIVFEDGGALGTWGITGNIVVVSPEGVLDGELQVAGSVTVGQVDVIPSMYGSE